MFVLRLTLLTGMGLFLFDRPMSTRVGPYRIGKTLGTGSFSKVKRMLHFVFLWLPFDPSSSGPHFALVLVDWLVGGQSVCMS